MFVNATGSNHESWIHCRIAGQSQTKADDGQGLVAADEGESDEGGGRTDVSDAVEQLPGRLHRKELLADHLVGDETDHVRWYYHQQIWKSR